MSSSELVPSRLAPCTDTQATSPAAYRPGTTVSLSDSASPVDVGRHAAHRVVRGREDRDRLVVRLDAEVGPGELGDVGQLLVDVLGLEVREVEVDVVAVGAAAAALAHLVGHRPGDHVARRQVLDRRGVALHEALAVLVAQDAALAACGLGQQYAETGQTGGVELEELHVLQRQTLAPDDAHAVAGQRVRVGRRTEDLAEAAGRQHHRLGREDMDLAGGELVGDDAGGARRRSCSRSST